MQDEKLKETAALKAVLKAALSTYCYQRQLFLRFSMPPFVRQFVLIQLYYHVYVSEPLQL